MRTGLHAGGALVWLGMLLAASGLPAAMHFFSVRRPSVPAADG